MGDNSVLVKLDPLRDAWESLGIMYATNENGTKHADPEQTLIRTVREFQNHRKMLKLSLAWLKEFGGLFHIERFKAFLDQLTAVELAWAGGLSSHMLENGDSRWKIIVASIESRIGTPMPSFSTSKLDELQVLRLGEDPYFKKFGLSIPMTGPADSKKITPFSVSVKNNLWLRMRVLFGTNWRADTATVLMLGLANNPYQAEQILGCAKETAYRNWKALKEAEAEDLLKGAVA